MFYVNLFTILLMIDVALAQTCLPMNSQGCKTGSDCCFIPGRYTQCDGSLQGLGKCRSNSLDICIATGNTGCVYNGDCCGDTGTTCPECVAGKCGIVPKACGRPAHSPPLTCQIPPCITLDNQVKTPSQSVPAVEEKPTQTVPNINPVASEAVKLYGLELLFILFVNWMI
jgi:hypothetical protein